VSQRRLDEAGQGDRLVGDEPVDPLDVTRVPARPAGIAAEADTTADEVHVWMRLQMGPLTGQPFGQALVVGVHPRDQRGARRSEPGLEGGDEAAARRGHDTDARIAGGVRVQHRARVVGRAVVHRHELPVGLGLGEQALNGRRQRRRRVAHRHHHRERGPCHIIGRMRDATHPPTWTRRRFAAAAEAP
jgi:hypothetical protein